MKASHKGYVHIVRILIDAKAEVNTQEEVCCYYHTLHNEWWEQQAHQLHSWKVMYTRSSLLLPISNIL